MSNNQTVHSTPGKVAAFFAAYPQRTYEKGQILVHAGDNPQAIFYLEKGRVRQYDISYRGDEIVVNVFKERAFFPMLWAVTDAENRYFFAADSAVVLRAAPKDEVLAFVRSSPEVMYDLLTRLYAGIDGLLGRMAHLMAGSAKSRVMYELIVECRRFGVRNTAGGYALQVTEAELAARAGLSRETVSRELQKLVRAGWAATQRGCLTVRSLSDLEEALGTEL